MWVKQTDTETPEDPWEKLIEPEKNAIFPDFSTELHISKFTTSITDKNLREKLLEEKELDVPKVVEQIQQITYGGKNKKDAIPGVLISNQEKRIKEKHIQK